MHRTIDIDGHQLACIEHNASAKNPPIIYLHGILNTICIQEAALTSILEGKRWIALSLPGHYPAKLRDDFQADQLTPEFIGDVLSKAIREISGGEPVHLIGHSTGGFSCMAIALAAPDLIRSICLVDAFAQGKWHSLALRPLQLMAKIPGMGYPIFSAYSRVAMGNRTLTKLFLRFISYQFKTVRENPAYADSLATILKETSLLNPADFYPYFRYMPTTSIVPSLKNIHIPTCIIHGKYDPVILPEHARDMDSQLPDSEMVWLDNCGHDPFSEAFDTLSDAIQDWYHKFDC